MEAAKTKVQQTKTKPTQAPKADPEKGNPAAASSEEVKVQRTKKAKPTPVPEADPEKGNPAAATVTVKSPASTQPSSSGTSAPATDGQQASVDSVNKDTGRGL